MVTSMNVLKAAGVSAIGEQYGNPLEAMRIIDDSLPGGGPVEAAFESFEIGLDHFSLNIPNGILRAALYEQAQGLETVTLHVPASLEDYTVDEAGVTAKLDNGQTITAPLIIGADGRGSLVRKIAGIKVWKKDYDQSAITCLINHSRSHNNIATEFHRPAGPLALVPLQGNRSSVVWVEKRHDADEIMKLPKDAFVQKLQDKTKDIPGGITLESSPECWPLCTIKAKALTAPRVALIAEAAHVMSPITAQGLNLSLRDVASLAETIVDAMRVGCDPGSPAILRQYERRRSLDMNSRVHGVNGMNLFVSNDLRTIKELRRAGLRSISRFTPARHFAMRHGLAPSLDQGRLTRGEAL